MLLGNLAGFCITRAFPHRRDGARCAVIDCARENLCTNNRGQPTTLSFISSSFFSSLSPPRKITISHRPTGRSRTSEPAGERKYTPPLLSRARRSNNSRTGRQWVALFGGKRAGGNDVPSGTPINGAARGFPLSSTPTSRSITSDSNFSFIKPHPPLSDPVYRMCRGILLATRRPRTTSPRIRARTDRRVLS